jgi:hypothetical protein
VEWQFMLGPKEEQKLAPSFLFVDNTNQI